MELNFTATFQEEPQEEPQEEEEESESDDEESKRRDRFKSERAKVNTISTSLSTNRTEIPDTLGTVLQVFVIFLI